MPLPTSVLVWGMIWGASLFVAMLHPFWRPKPRKEVRR